MRHFTQRQATLALIGLIFFTLAIITIDIFRDPASAFGPQKQVFIVALFIAGALWLATWIDWPFARQATVLATAVIAGFAIPESSFANSIPQGALIPPIVAMVISGIPGIVSSAFIVYGLLYWRSGGSDLLTDPNSLAVFMAAIGGLILGRAVVNARLAQERDLLQALMDNIPDMIYFKDRASRFTRLNAAHLKLFGESDSEAIIGKTDFDFQPLELSKAFFKEEQQMMTTGESITDRIEYNPTPDGQPRWLSATKVPIRGPDGRITGMVGISRNVTERMLLESALQDYAEELEKKNQELKNFVSIASHDLREPLRKIQMFSNRLLEKQAGQLDDRGQEYLRRMDNAAARMNALIQDLLDYSRLNTHGGAFEPLSLAEVAAEVLADLESLIEGTKGQVIVADLPVIEADHTQMHQLLQNIIGNGLKFHKPDTPPIVNVESELIQKPGKDNGVNLTISDNGIGFDERYLPQIFAMFQRLHTRDEFEGTGIGLAICQRIVERHNGTITAHSQPGEGATFVIELPLKQPVDTAVTP